MQLKDNDELRSLLTDIFPGFSIEATPAPSGQRVVYFGRFSPDTSVEAQASWSNWGQVVLKVSAGLRPQTIAYLQREAATLADIQSNAFPRIFMDNLIAENPVTERELNPKLYVTVEERIESDPLSSALAQFATELAICGLLKKIVSALNHLWLHKKAPDYVLISADSTGEPPPPV